MDELDSPKINAEIINNDILENFYEQNPALNDMRTSAANKGLNRLVQDMDSNVARLAGTDSSVSVEPLQGTNPSHFSVDEIIHSERHDHQVAKSLVELVTSTGIAEEGKKVHKSLFHTSLSTNYSPGHFSNEQVQETVHTLLDLLGSDESQLTEAPALTGEDAEMLRVDSGSFMHGGTIEDIVVREAPMSNDADSSRVVQVINFTWNPSNVEYDPPRQSQNPSGNIVLRVIDK